MLFLVKIDLDFRASKKMFTNSLFIPINIVKIISYEVNYQSNVSLEGEF